MRTLSPADTGRPNRHWRLLALAVLGFCEALLVTYSFNFGTGLPEWVNPVAYAKGLAQAGTLALAAFALIVWPQRQTVLTVWNETARTHNWRAALLANIGLFAALLLASFAFTRFAAHASEPPWLWFALYCCLLLATAASLAGVAAPLAFWRWLARAMPAKVAAALLSAVLLVLAGELSQEGWSQLSGATLSVSHWFLTLYESGVVLDPRRLLLGAGDFHVLITQECSGYEGIGLTTAFLALYFWMMRARLRFPNVLVLIPAALAAVWLLNALRIAILISIGRHISPDIAINGFHSQAGWIGFLAVAISVMALSHRVPFFRARPRERSRIAADPNQQLVLALLVPFIALMATSIVASLFAPHDEWLYVLKVLAVGATLWTFRKVYAQFASAVSPLSLVVGLAVGALWVATDRRAENDTIELQSWLAALPVWAAAAWVACRALGAIVLVPMTEELAFRGFLQRALVRRDFFSVAPGHFTWLSFIATSVLFGLIHQRWAAAALAGAIYAVMVYRTNRLSDAIAAHMATNAVIVVWAIVMQQWWML